MPARTPETTVEEATGIGRPPGEPRDDVAPLWDRAGSAAIGGALLIDGLRGRSLGGAAKALVGGWLSYRALRGRATLSRAFGSNGSSMSEWSERAIGAAPVSVSKSVTVGESADELLAVLEDSAALDRVAGPVVDVTELGAGRHRWTVRGPAGRRLSWETRLAAETREDRVRWEVVDGPSLLAGSKVIREWSLSVADASGGRGTTATLDVHLDPPGGALGARTVERLDVVPETVLAGVLDRLKSLAETGEIPTLDGNPSARGRGDLA